MSFTGISNRALVCAAGVVAAALGWLAAGELYFPLKTAMHWDEVARYAYPGAEPVAGGFWAGLLGVLGTFGESFENGRTAVAFMRLVRALTGCRPEDAFYTYRLFTFVFSLVAAAWFVRRAGGVWACFLYLLAPALWIQAGEVMREPLFLPLALFWFGLAAGPASGRARPPAPWFGDAVFMVLLCWLMLMTNVQFTIITVCVTALVNVIMVFPAGIRGGRGSWWVPLVVLAGVVELGAVAWFFSHPSHSFDQMIGYFAGYFTDAANVRYTLPPGAAFHEKYLFGLRSFLWLCMPSLPVVLLALAGLAAKWRSKSALAPAEKFMLLVVAVQLPLYAFGFSHNIQDRYHYLPGMFMLLVLSRYLPAGVTAVCERWRALRALRAKRAAWAFAFGAFAACWVAYDYYSVFKELPCFANLHDYTFYRGDTAACDETRTAFGLVKRRWFVSFPHHSYLGRFPNARPGAGYPPSNEPLDRVRSALVKDMYPVALSHNPNYLAQQALMLMYLEKFGVPPVERGARGVFLVGLGFAPASPYISFSYGPYEGHSLQKLEEEWRIRLAGRKHEVLVDAVTPAYTLKIFLIPHAF